MTRIIGLGIDTSFDDTAVAVVADGREILANLCVSQFAEHEEFGGIIPERASRLHVEMIFPLIRRALDEASIGLSDIDYVATTNEPGLVGSLLVGVTAGKALAMALGTPLVGVNHLEAHVHAALMEHSDLEAPYLSLVISGANTLLFHHPDHEDFALLGGTTDDAVGECIDKTARLLGLPMPGGPALQQLALRGNPKAIRFPRPMIRSGDYQFSFSGLKTAVLYHLRDNPDTPHEDVAAALLAAIADVLCVKAFRAVHALDVDTIVLCGGAAASLQIREVFAARARTDGVRLVVPSIALCTDNAAMIASRAFSPHRRGEHAELSLPVTATVTWNRREISDDDGAAS